MADERMNAVLVAGLMALVLGSCGKEAGRAPGDSMNGAATVKRLTDDGGSRYALHTYDPRDLMPLALGNTWTYSWKSPAVKGAEEVETVGPAAMCFQYYKFGKRVSVLSEMRKARAHEETYGITRQDGDCFFFTISSKPDVPEGQLRDGRYEDSVEKCWTKWESQSGAAWDVGLTESIKRNWGIHKDYLLDGKPVPQDFPADHRNAIHVKFENGKWKSWFRMWFSNNPRFHKGFLLIPITEYDARGVEVDVPAGRFRGCVKTVVKVYRDEKDVDDLAIERYFDGADSPLLWETHTFWAPNVGMVWEYQKLPGGRIAHELELLSFDLKKAGQE